MRTFEEVFNDLTDLVRAIVLGFMFQLDGFTVRLGGPRPDSSMLFGLVGTAGALLDALAARDRLPRTERDARNSRVDRLEMKLVSRIRLARTLGLARAKAPSADEVLGVLQTLRAKEGTGETMEIVRRLRKWAGATDEEVASQDGVPTADRAEEIARLLEGAWDDDRDVDDRTWAEAQMWASEKLVSAAARAPGLLEKAVRESRRLTDLVNLLGKDAEGVIHQQKDLLKKQGIEALQLAEELENAFEREFGKDAEEERAGPAPFEGPFGGMFH